MKMPEALVIIAGMALIGLICWMKQSALPLLLLIFIAMMAG